MKFLTTSALALTLAAGGAIAQSTADSGMMTDDGMAYGTAELNNMTADLIRTRDITGGTIYTTSEADDEGWDADVMHESVGSDWNQIGEIEDIVLTSDGRVRGIVAEVGGFLDIGDKHVLLSVSDLNLVAVDDASYAYVTRFNEEELEEMEGVDEGFWN